MFRSIGLLASSVFATGFVSLGTALFFFLVARAVGPREFGRFSQIYALATLLSIFISYGYPQRILHTFHELEAEYGGLPMRILHLQVFFFLTMSMVGVAICVAMDLDVISYSLIWLGAAVLAGANMMQTVLRALERHDHDAKLRVGGKAILLLLLAVGFWLEKTDIAFYSLCYLLACVAEYVAAHWNLRKFTRLHREPVRLKNILAEGKEGFSYLVDVFADRSIGALDVLLVGLFSSDLNAGLYSAGQKITQLGLVFTQPLLNVSVPPLSRMPLGGAQLRRGVGITLGSALTFGSVFALFLILFRSPLTHLLFGEKFSELPDLLPTLAVFSVLRFIGAGASVSLLAIGEQKLRMRINLINSIAFLVYGAALSSLLGAAGMACAAVLYAFLGALSVFVVLARKVYLSRPMPTSSP